MGIGIYGETHLEAGLIVTRDDDRLDDGREWKRYPAFVRS